ncbi:hypothetical protein POM88_035163 [Heracleum sosnowskyi]|uniref:Pesticidal crystal cry8Ba protein n=1 Tax=Heracleum sosnowskyi TaxID=360622 RepID=A0AAD8HLX4_9APIA|nr:hypothetical protein POM88_035163 [Heracleum sosnowskyi]
MYTTQGLYTTSLSSADQGCFCNNTQTSTSGLQLPSPSEFSTPRRVSQDFGTISSDSKFDSSEKKFYGSNCYYIQENQKLYNYANPSAPPISDPGEEIKQDEELSSASMPSAPDVYLFERKPKTFNLQNDIRKELPGMTAKSVANGVPPSRPTRLPTFHASELAAKESIWIAESITPIGGGIAELADEEAISKSKKVFRKIKVQVCKVKLSKDSPTGCSFSFIRVPKIKLKAIRDGLSKIQSNLSSRWQSFRKAHFAPHRSANGCFSRPIKQVSGLPKAGIKTSSSSDSFSYDVQEKYSCLLRLKSSVVEDSIRMQPGSGESHIFFPDSLQDALTVEVQDSTGKYYGRVVAQVAAISDVKGDKLRWWSIYREPEHEVVGKVQLCIHYSTESNHLKEHDHIFRAYTKVNDSWNWLLTEFASIYGVSDAYSKLRYLSYIMDVATPTSDCLNLVYDLLRSVLTNGKSTLSQQGNRILGEIEDQLEQVFTLVFDNYKLLDESTQSGMTDIFRPVTGSAVPVLEPAVKIYSLLHDIFLPEAQDKLCSYFQAAAKKRSRRHLMDTDKYVKGNNEGRLDVETIRNEIFTDIDIHNQHVLPSYICLPNISTAIYSAELCNRLRSFLIACQPTGPLPHRISPVIGGVDAKGLFHSYITTWIEDKRLKLLEACKSEKVKWSGVGTRYSTTPFADKMYGHLQEMLNDFSIIISRWPEYTFTLEKASQEAIVDIKKAVAETMDKQYADVVSPLKENMSGKNFCSRFVQKLIKGSASPYVVPDELCILLNSMKRILDHLLPNIGRQLKSWGSCIPHGGSTVPGERLGEVTVMLRSKFRTCVQEVAEKLAGNTRLHSGTKLKRILHDSKANVRESDIRRRMQQLIEEITKTINHLYTILETHVFVEICRAYWDQLGKDVAIFVDKRKENSSWYRGSRIVVSILDSTFESQLQQLLGHSLPPEGLKSPRSILDVRSMLDTSSHNGRTYFY